MRARRRLIVLLALLAVACDSTASLSPSAPASPNASTEPGASAAPSGSIDPAASGDPGPGPGGAAPSSQALIAADLASGAIDDATALKYRAWALFWDPRLPERYDGSGSTGEDNELFDEIATLAPTLSGDSRAELEAYLLRPTDPASPLSAPGPESVASGNGTTLFGRAGPAAAASPAPTPDTCMSSGGGWEKQDWSPDGTADRGIRVWVCSRSAAAAATVQNAVIEVAKKLWATMTAAVPNGMGPPRPDTDATPNDGNGKVDVYVLDSRATCRQRGDECEEIDGNSVAAKLSVSPSKCGGAGFGARACAAYMILGRDRVTSDKFPADFAHEFFHVLQAAHNDTSWPNWYEEASASWAEWQFVALGPFAAGQKQAAKSNLFDNFKLYQDQGPSLLAMGRDEDPLAASPEYWTWTWPLFQTIRSRNKVFESWSALESAFNPASFDQALDGQFAFKKHVRDYAVWNTQPPTYMPPTSTGLDTDRWQTKPNLASLPTRQHRPSVNPKDLPRGVSSHPVTITALNAHYEPILVADFAIREITIDISRLRGASRADLDVLLDLGLSETSNTNEWRRISSSGSTVTLCRDNPDENVQFMDVVISNHAYGRDRSYRKPDPNLSVTGSYTIEAKTVCEVPDHYTGTIGGSNSRGDHWTGTATFDLVSVPDPRGSCALGTYCYEFVTGSVTWTCKSGNTVSVALSPPDNHGDLTLYITQEGRPDRDRTYGGIIVASETEKCPVPPPEEFAIAAWTVVGWLSIVGEPTTKIATDWTLAASYSHSGCGIEGDCGTQSWSWDLQPVFDTPP